MLLKVSAYFAHSGRGRVLLVMDFTVIFVYRKIHCFHCFYYIGLGYAAVAVEEDVHREYYNPNDKKVLRMTVELVGEELVNNL